MSGIKGRSGRKRKTLTREQALMSLTKKLPMAIQTIAETIEGTNKDRLRYEAAVEIKDSVMGKPHQATSVDLKGGKSLGISTLLELYQMISNLRLQSPPEPLQLEYKVIDSEVSDNV